MDQGSCQVSETEGERESAGRPWDEAVTALRLVCSRGEIRAGRDYLDPESKRPVYPSWLCELADGATVPAAGVSPLPWVFGKGACLESTHGPHGTSYRRCERRG